MSSVLKKMYIENTLNKEQTLYILFEKKKKDGFASLPGTFKGISEADNIAELWGQHYFI